MSVKMHFCWIECILSHIPMNRCYCIDAGIDVRNMYIFITRYMVSFSSWTMFHVDWDYVWSCQIGPGVDVIIVSNFEQIAMGVLDTHSFLPSLRLFHGSTVWTFDWCCLYYAIRNSLLALLEALFARVCAYILPNLLPMIATRRFPP